MLTINISKTELKKAFFGGHASFSQEITAEGKSIENAEVILLKIMLENYKSDIKQEVA